MGCRGASCECGRWWSQRQEGLSPAPRRRKKRRPRAQGGAPRLSPPCSSMMGPARVPSQRQPWERNPATPAPHQQSAVGPAFVLVFMKARGSDPCDPAKQRQLFWGLPVAPFVRRVCWGARVACVLGGCFLVLGVCSRFEGLWRFSRHRPCRTGKCNPRASGQVLLVSV